MCCFFSSLTMFRINDVDRSELKYFISDLIKFMYINGITEHKLISERLYRKYVRLEDTHTTLKLIISIKDQFLNENVDMRDLYQRYMNSLSKALNDNVELLNAGYNEISEVRIGLELPYCLEEQKLPNKFYDNLPPNAEPYMVKRNTDETIYSEVFKR